VIELSIRKSNATRSDDHARAMTLNDLYNHNKAKPRNAEDFGQMAVDTSNHELIEVNEVIKGIPKPTHN